MIEKGFNQVNEAPFQLVEAKQATEASEAEFDMSERSQR